MKKLVIAFVIVLVVLLTSIAFGEEKVRGPRGEGFRGGPRHGMMHKDITPEMKKKFEARRAEFMKNMTPEMKKKMEARRVEMMKKFGSKEHKAEMIKKFAEMKKNGKKPEVDKRSRGHRGRPDTIRGRHSRSEKGKCPMMGKGRGHHGRGQTMHRRGPVRGHGQIRHRGGSHRGRGMTHSRGRNFRSGR